MSGFLMHQEVRNDPGDLSAAAHDRIRDGAHNANTATAIDQPDLAFRHHASQRDGHVSMGFRPVIRGAAIDTEG